MHARNLLRPGHLQGNVLFSVINRIFVMDNYLGLIIINLLSLKERMVILLEIICGLFLISLCLSVVPLTIYISEARG